MAHPFEERRFGRFKISGRMVRACPSAVVAATSGMLILRAEAFFRDDSIEYHAASEHFDKIADGEDLPLYEAQVRDLVGGKHHITWTRVDR